MFWVLGLRKFPNISSMCVRRLKDSIHAGDPQTSRWRSFESAGPGSSALGAPGSACSS